ncbi:MAG TPA: adenylate/guanylate cyclase domain-containing protein [Stellaceae bacterium]
MPEAEERVERRLTAILAADVAGYSRLMGLDEEGTLAALKGHRRELLDPKIVEHRGRIVKTTGDGLLVEFASVVDAVRCAVDLQRRMAERNIGVPAEQRIEFRIGVNVGDIIIDEGDIYGDGVNIAARLEALAEPGGICVSRVVRDQVRDKLDIAFEDMGEQQVKNIARAVRAFRVGPTSPHPDPPPACGGGKRVSAGGGFCSARAHTARQAVDRGAAVHQYERRPRAGIFCRRHGRGDHHRSLSHPLAVRDRAQFKLYLQGPSG